MTPLARLLSLRVDFRDEAAAAEVTPERLDEYATGHGWRRFADDERWWQYTIGEDPNGPVLMVPRVSHWVDYGRRALEAIRELAEHEERSALAVWADLAGLHDGAAETAEDMTRMLVGIVTRPAMYGTMPETVLFQALLALEVRASLLGEADPEAAYEAAKARRRIPSSLHASSRLDVNGIADLVAELAGMTPPPREDAAGEAAPVPDAPEPVKVRVRPASAQVTLFAEPPRPRRTTVHRWGVLRDEAMPHPAKPDETVAARVQTCPHCRCRKRIANTGPRLGAEAMYSADGAEWSHAVPVCVRKG